MQNKKMTYTINPENFAISFFDGINPEPFQYQPDYPNLDPFDSYEEAEAWAKLAIASHDSDCEFFPPDGKNQAPRKKPTKEELAVAKLQGLGLSVQELKNLLGLQ